MLKIIRKIVACILFGIATANPAIADKPLLPNTFVQSMLYGIKTTTGPRDLTWRSIGEGPMNRTCPMVYVDNPSIASMQDADPVKPVNMRASFYGNQYHGGILNDADKKTNVRFHECDATVVAYNKLPKGTVLRVTNPKNGHTIMVVVQDTGGPTVDHVLDLSRGAAELLDPNYWEKGVLRLRVEVLGRPHKA